MPSQTKPNVNIVWASGGLATPVPDAKQALGYVAEIPEYDLFNGMIQQLSAFQKHVNQEGVPKWDALTPYFTDGYAKGNGTIYVALQDSTGQALPAAGASNAYWADLFRGARNYAVGGGTANAQTATYTPALPVVDGTVARFKAVAANTGPATFNGSPILGGAGQALQGGEIALGGSVTLVRLGANWVILNSTSGAVQVPAATQSQHAMQLGQATGRMAGLPRFLTSGGAVVKTPGVTRWRVRLWGGGGQGGGTQATSASQAAAGGGGSKGSYAEAWFDVTNLVSANLVLGAGGSTAAAGADGVAGGTSTLTLDGNSLTCPGGPGGKVGPATSSLPNEGGSAALFSLSPTHVGALMFLATPGGGATSGVALSLASAQPGMGGAAEIGASRAASTGNNAGGYASGGSGGRSLINTGANNGPFGTPAVAVIEEYYL